MSTIQEALNAVTGAITPKKVIAKKDGANVAPLLEGSFASLALKAGENLAEATKLQAKADELKAAVNAAIKQLHAASVVVGRTGKCAIATAFKDGLLNGGLSEGSARNYLTVFRQAVASGEPVTDWNPARAKAPSAEDGTENEGKKTDKKVKVPTTLADILAKAYSLNGGEDLKAVCFRIEEDYQDDKIDSFYAGVVSFLQLHGVEL